MTAARTPEDAPPSPRSASRASSSGVLATRPTRRTDRRVSSAPVSLEAVSRLLNGLDAEQRQAVTHGEGPLLVVAGPGTGKTRVITRRIAWLIATKRARPSEILALTFTDKAADEMQARVDELVPYGQSDTAIHTFHAFGDRLIREFALELGLTTDLRVLSRAEAAILLRERLFALDLAEYRPLGDPTRFLSALVDLFQRAKDEGVTPEEYEAHAARLSVTAETLAARTGRDEEAAAAHEEARRQMELARAYGSYQKLLAEKGCIDFGDQVLLALRLLREHPSMHADVRRRFRYVLVDEFQDTNTAQLALVESLAGPSGNVTVVGDDDQSIYTFRGAALGNMLGSEARFPRGRRIVLRRNYRSRPPILAAAERLISHNDPVGSEARRDDRSLIAVRRRGRAAPVRHVAFRTVGEEADGVADEIARRVEQGAAPGDFAILVRANVDADPFLRSLNMRGLPWRFSGASGLYARPEVRELLSFLRAVADPTSTVDLYGLATAEPYGLGGPDLSRIMEMGRRRHLPLWDMLEELQDQPALLRISSETRQRIGRLVADLRAALELSHQRPAGEVLYDHLKRSGRLARLAATPTSAAEEALQNVARLFEIVRAQSRVLADDRVQFLANHLKTLIDAGDDPATAELDEDPRAVAVLTVHKAKGLEFPVVFLVGLADGRFPARSRPERLRFPDELCRARASAKHEGDVPWAEERRLFFVALTRARDELVLTHSSEAAGSRVRRPSVFLAEALDRPLDSLSPAAGQPSIVSEALRARGDAGRATVTVLTSPDGAGGGARGARGSDRPGAGTQHPSECVEAPSERLSLSFSQIDDYLACPLKFKLRHVLGVPVPSHHALVYGSALHQAVAAFNIRRRRGETMTEAGLFEVFAAHWTSEGFLSREHEDARFAAGRDALRRFRDREIASGSPVPVGVEQEFSFMLGRDRVRGRFDRVDAEPEGVVVTDYKSGDVRDQAKADRKARESLQLQIYALAQQATTGSLPAAVRLHFLDSGVIGRARVAPARLDRAREKLERAADAIRRRRFEPTPDPVGCGFCPFRHICPASAA